MKTIIIFTFLLCSNQASFGQQQYNDILWLREGGSWAFNTDVHASKLRERIYTDGAGECQIWPLNQTIIPSKLDYGGDTYSSVFARGDSELICGWNDGHVDVWNVFSNTRMVLCNLDSETLAYIDATPDGNLIAASSINGLFFYDRTTGKTTQWSDFKGAMCISPDGKFILACKAQELDLTQELDLINISTLQTVHSYPGYWQPVSAVKFNPAKPDEFVIIGLPGTILMDTSGSQLAILPSANVVDFNDAVSFSPDGTMFAAAGGNGIVLTNIENQNSFTIPGPGDYISFLDNDTLAATSGTNVFLYSILNKSYLGPISGHSGSVQSLTYTRDGEHLLSISSDGTLLEWNAKTGALENSEYDSLQLVTLAASNYSDNIIGVGGSGELYKWQNINSSPITLRGPIQDTFQYGGIYDAHIAFSPSDSVFAVAVDLTFEAPPDNSNAPQLWNIQNNSFVRSFEPDPHESGQSWPLLSLDFSSDGSMMVGSNGSNELIWSSNKTVTIDSYLAGQLLSSNYLSGAGGPAFFLPGDTLLSSIVSGGVAITPIACKDCDTFSALLNSNIYCDNFLPLRGGEVFAGIGERNVNHDRDSVAQVVDASTAIVLKSYFNLGEMQRSIAVNPITDEFATGGENGTIIVWKDPRSSDAVKQTHYQTLLPLEAFMTNGHITIRLPASTFAGKIFVYRSDGQCYYTSPVQAGESSVTSPALPSGDYFIVFEPAIGERSFTKVSLFQ